MRRLVSASRAFVPAHFYLSVSFLLLLGSSSAQTITDAASSTMTANDLCNVCNPGKVVTDFDALLPAGVDYYIPGVVTCRDAQHLGNLGMIPAAECVLLRFQSSIACGCTEASLVPPTVPTAPIPPPSSITMEPTGMPIMVTTTTPTTAPTSTPIMAATSTPTMAPTSLPTMVTTSAPTMTPTTVPIQVTTSTPIMLVTPTTSPLVPTSDVGSTTEAPILSPVATSSPATNPEIAPTGGDDKEQLGDGDDEEDGDDTIWDLDRNVFYAVIAGICLAVIFCFVLAFMVFRRPAPVSPIVTEFSPPPENDNPKHPPIGTQMAFPPIESQEPPVAPLASRLAVETARIGLSDIPVSEGSTASSLSSLRQDMSSRKVIVPAGKLGVVIDTTLEGARIHSVSETSPLYGQVFVGDLILTVNDVDTRAMTGAALSSLMAQTGGAPRELVLLSEDVTAPSISAILASRPPAPPEEAPDEAPTDDGGGDDDEQPEAPRRKLVMLFSSMPMNRQVTNQQDRAITALNAHGIVYDMLDGATHPDLREELFEVSPLERGVYPQWFWVDLDTGHATFWGDWEVFSLSNDNGRLVEEFGGGVAP